jgi:glycyl-tRNA synthetase (class II)
VIEPSFGIGRIIYALLEQSYWVRNPDNPAVALSDAELRAKKAAADKSQIELMRGVLSLSPLLAPTKGSISWLNFFFCF